MIDFGFGVTLGAFEGGERSRNWRNDPKIWRWTRQNDLISSTDHSRWFEAQAKDPNVKMYVIFRDLDYVGICGLTSINHLNRNAEFSLYIGPEFQGRKIAKPALLTLFAHGFRNMGLKSIWGETFEGNKALNMFKQIGMTVDGTRRQFYFKDGRFHDAHLISILSDEFFYQHGEKSCFG